MVLQQVPHHDGRKAGQASLLVLTPMHGRDSHGAVASLSSVAKMPWRDCSDGISNTFSIIPNALGKGSDVYFHGSELDLEHIDFSDMNLISD